MLSVVHEKQVMAKRDQARTVIKGKRSQTKDAAEPGISGPSRRRWLLMGAVGACASAAALWTMRRKSGPPIYGYEIVNTYPHDSTAFCQGLIFANGVLYEGTGTYGASSLRKIDLQSGQVLKQQCLPAQYFGEGITLWRDRILQLTWQNRVGFVYDPDSLEALDTFRFSGEGWGLTHDGQRLIQSDGTAELRFLDPETFEVAQIMRVHSQGLRVSQLNELEYIAGEIYANIWHSDRIARISPTTGEVLAWIDLTGLLSARERGDPENVLNGIAFDAQGGRLFVTGKNWPKLFEIRLQ